MTEKNKTKEKKEAADERQHESAKAPVELE
jgi:hypothetical protein